MPSSSLLTLPDDILLDIFGTYLGNTDALQLIGNRQLFELCMSESNMTNKTTNKTLNYSVLSIVDAAQECMHERYFKCHLFAKYGALESERLGTKRCAIVQPMVVT